MAHVLQDKLSGDKQKCKQEAKRPCSLTTSFLPAKIELKLPNRTTNALNTKYNHYIFKWLQQLTKTPQFYNVPVPMSVTYFSHYTLPIQIKSKGLLKNNDDQSHFRNCGDTPSTILNFRCFPHPTPHSAPLLPCGPKMLEI